jgi:hypothetical protein
MKFGTRALLLSVLILAGCRSPHEVAETSYQAAASSDTVVRQPREATTTVTTTTTATEPSSTRTATEDVRPGPASTESPRPERPPPTTTDHKPIEAASPRAVPSQLDFPTAKPVEGKPGYVYSPFDPGKYVDVSGYAPGSKVKDPYSGKIFLVP